MQLPDARFRRVDGDLCKHAKSLVAVGLSHRKGVPHDSEHPINDREAAIALLTAGWTSVDTSIEEDASNDRGETLPANGQPVNMAEAIDHEALSYRAWQSPIGDF